jgi:hypothetical protein
MPSCPSPSPESGPAVYSRLRLPSSQAKRDVVNEYWVSGQRPEQGADAKIYAKQKAWAQGPYPAHRSFKCSQASVALIRLSTCFLPVVGVPVGSYVNHINHRGGFVC